MEVSVPQSQARLRSRQPRHPCRPCLEIKGRDRAGHRLGGASGAARADPDEQTFARYALVGKHDASETVGPDAVDIILQLELLRRESLARYKAHVPCVVNQDVDFAGLVQDFSIPTTRDSSLTTFRATGRTSTFPFLDEGFQCLGRRRCWGGIRHASVRQCGRLQRTYYRDC